MSTTNHLRIRRSAGQRQALAGVEREIRANDRNGRRKYLEAYTHAFREYEGLLDNAELQKLILSADIILIGDYHALPAAQRYAAALFEQRAQPGDRPVVLGVETIFARHQHVLGEWWRREVDEKELRERIRFDLDWGYDWEPFYELLVAARDHGEAIYGIDCMPREDLRKIGARDRHAAHKISEIRQLHPNAVIVVLFGESHLAPDHLPRALREQLPGERVLTVLQNVDALYWHAAGERREQVEAVRVSDDVVCVFNSTPLEKYESYRLCLSRWREETENGPDAGPTIYNLIDSLVRFLNINRYCSHNGTQPKFLVDLLPEVYCPPSDAYLRRLLSRKNIPEAEQHSMLRQVEERGSAYVPHVNAFYVRDFQLMYAAEEAARFLHHACRGLPTRSNGHVPASPGAEDRFCTAVLEHALSYFGSRVIYPSRPAVRGAAFNEQSANQIIQCALAADVVQCETTARQFGYVLGSDLYDAYLDARFNRRMLRQLFLTSLREPARARQVCLELAEAVASARGC